MTIPLPKSGSQTHYVFAVAYLALGCLLTTACVTHDPATAVTGARGADLTRLIGVMLDEVGLAATLLAGWLLALIGSAFHILKARGVI